MGAEDPKPRRGSRGRGPRPVTPSGLMSPTGERAASKRLPAAPLNEGAGVPSRKRDRGCGIAPSAAKVEPASWPRGAAAHQGAPRGARPVVGRAADTTRTDPSLRSKLKCRTLAKAVGPGLKTQPAALRTPRPSAEHDANPTGGAEQQVQTQPSRGSTTLETTAPSGHTEGPARGERSGARG